VTLDAEADCGELPNLGVVEDRLVAPERSFGHLAGDRVGYIVIGIDGARDDGLAEAQRGFDHRPTTAPDDRVGCE
jgi:hypothetical protein